MARAGGGWSGIGLFGGNDATSAAHQAKDWSATPLGPVATWSPALRAAVRTVMPSRIPMLLWWGPRLVQIFNHAYTPVLGDKYPDAVGQPGDECWSEVWDELRPLAEQALAGHATYSENQRLHLHRHGYLEETYWTFSYSPVLAEDGSVAGVFVATTDVTARVLGERRMETLRRLGMLSIAEADTPADVCRAALDVLAGSGADLPYVRAYLRPDGGDLALAASTGRHDAVSDAVTDAVRLAAETGQVVRLVDVVVSPLLVGGRVAGVLVLGLSPYREFDDAYATFAELVAATVESAVGDAIAYAAERDRATALEELDAAKTRFFENISHEFRTPLTLLLGPLRSLLDTAPPDQRNTVAAAHRAALRMRRLVDGLLDVTTAHADRLRGRPEPTDVGVLTAECASMFRSAAESIGVSLVVGTEPVVAAVDQEMWARIVLNLVSNALKYTEEGTVTVALRRADGEIVLTVADTGIGIPLAEQGRIFERFHQVDSAGGRSREGTGIGLALVADLVTALGGQVKVTSQEGTGSAFTVTIPRVPTDATPADTHARVAELGAAFVGETRQWDPPSAAPVPGTGDRRILLVEDNADMRDYVTRLLTEQQWTVDAVAAADTALAHARAVRPDLVLSDVMLPDRDGLTLLRDLRADPSLARLPVILLTARAGTESTVEGLHHGADDYIVKPFHPSELIARVRVHLELSHFRETLIRQGEQEADGLRTSINTRGVIGQATGIIMAIHRCDTEAAFARLTVMSQHQNVKLRDLASDLVHKFVANLPA